MQILSMSRLTNTEQRGVLLANYILWGSHIHYVVFSPCVESGSLLRLMLAALSCCFFGFGVLYIPATRHYPTTFVISLVALKMKHSIQKYK